MSSHPLTKTITAKRVMTITSIRGYHFLRPIAINPGVFDISKKADDGRYGFRGHYCLQSYLYRFFYRFFTPFNALALLVCWLPLAIRSLPTVIMGNYG
jgi:hypothetical protein